MNTMTQTTPVQPTDSPPAADAVEQLLVKSDAGTLTLDDCAAGWTVVRSRLRALEEIKALVEDAIVRHLEATGEEIVVGEVRYYAGHPSTKKCVDPAAVVEAVLKRAEGDVGAIVTCLASNPFKLTELKLLLGDLPPGAYVTETRPKLMEGKPKKALLSSNDRFAKGSRAPVPTGGQA
jgi:hypothetical protein